jgi:hypothetical protein
MDSLTRIVYQQLMDYIYIGLGRERFGWWEVPEWLPWEGGKWKKGSVAGEDGCQVGTK